MNNFFSLLKVQFLNFLQTNKGKNKKSLRVKTSFQKGLIFLLIIVLLGGVSYLYSRMFAELLIISGDIFSLTPFLIAYACFINMILSFHSVGSVLFSNKDYDLLSSLPIKKSTIIFSKLTVMSLMGVGISLVMSVPTFFVYGNYGAVLSTSYVLYSIILAVFAPFSVMAIITLVATSVYIAFAGAKRKTLWQTLALSLFFIICFSAGIVFGGEEDVFGMVKVIYFLYPLMIKATSSYESLLLFILINVASFSVVAIIVSLFYHKINTLLKRSYKNKGFTLSNYDKGISDKAILKREFKQFFSYPMYIINVFIGPILSVGASIVFAILVADMGGEKIVKEAFILILPSVLIFAHMLVSSTSASISIEGKHFWLIKTLPIEENKLLKAKLLVNVIINVLPAIFSSLIASIFVSPNVLYAIVISIIVIGGALLSGTLGLLFNLRFPKLDWQNVNQVTKNGLPCLLIIIIAVLFAGFSFSVMFIANETFTPLILLSILAGVMVITNVISYVILAKKGKELLDRI